MLDGATNLPCVQPLVVTCKWLEGVSHIQLLLLIFYQITATYQTRNGCGMSTNRSPPMLHAGFLRVMCVSSTHTSTTMPVSPCVTNNTEESLTLFEFQMLTSLTCVLKLLLKTREWPPPNATQSFRMGEKLKFAFVNPVPDKCHATIQICFH